MESVLVVEDEQDIATLLQVHLQELSLEVCVCNNGEQALSLLSRRTFDLLLLDVMLPGISGLDICRQVRLDKPAQSIIMLTSKSSEADRVVGLELGADDYLTKPFSIRELQARVRAQLRKVKLLAQAQTQETDQMSSLLKIGELTMNVQQHKAHIASRMLELTATEFDLLYFLASHPDQVFSREQLLNSVWGYQHSGYEHTVNSHINRLRNKVEFNAADPQYIQTVWGVGYKFCAA